MVAEPQEPQGPAPQEEVRGESAQGPTHPSVDRRKASPGAYLFISNYDTYIYVSTTCELGSGFVWNPSFMIPRFPRVILEYRR